MFTISATLLIISIILRPYGSEFIQLLETYKRNSKERDELPFRIRHSSNKGAENYKLISEYIPNTGLFILSLLILVLITLEYNTYVDLDGQIYPIGYQIFGTGIIVRERFHGELGDSSISVDRDLRTLLEGTFGFSCILIGFFLRGVYLIS